MYCLFTESRTGACMEGLSGSVVMVLVGLSGRVLMAMWELVSTEPQESCMQLYTVCR